MKLVISAALRQAQPFLPEKLHSANGLDGKKGGVIWKLDVESGRFTTFFRVEPACIDSFRGYAPPGKMNLERFTGMCEYDGCYFVTTFNAVLVIEKETARLVSVYSQPSFNDLHYCLAYEKAQVVVNTGLECLEIFDRQWKQTGRIVFDNERDIDGRDWRHVYSTKPHKYHLNRAFMLQDDLWCTRCLTQDAVKVEDASTKIEIDAGMPHDGLVYDGCVFFTTTNGCIISYRATDINDPGTVLQLKNVMPTSDFAWARGLHITTDNMFVGSSKFRSTKSDEFISRLRKLHSNTSNSAVIQLSRGLNKIIARFETPDPEAAIFSILSLNTD